LWRPVPLGVGLGVENKCIGQSSESRRRLINEAVRLAERRHLSLMQALLPTDMDPDAELLRAAGFKRAADLLYLVATADSFPSDLPSTSLSLAQFQGTDVAKMERIVEQTYEGTLDCPALNNSRQISDVLAGYRSIGSSGSKLWWFVQSQNCDIGCVLVAEHCPQMWEIVYLGIVPAFRGQGYGLEATRLVQYAGLKRGVDRLVLAVDTNNDPAIDLYAKAGFLAWDRQSVFLWRAADPHP
jgi:ribosomal protein S18 acetylase RimI-like enzyme